MPPATKPELDRQRLRQVVTQCSPLVDLLDKELVPHRLPDINASEREVWAAVGERRLVDRLLKIRSETNGTLPTLIPGS